MNYLFLMDENSETGDVKKTYIVRNCKSLIAACKIVHPILVKDDPKNWGGSKWQELRDGIGEGNFTCYATEEVIQVAE